MKQKIIRIGETVEGYNYPVVNEREVRATAGIMLFLGLLTLFFVQTKIMYDLIYLTVSLFLIEFFLKTIIGPHASPLSIFSRVIIRKQEPEYVGAIQKKFAWGLGLIMATTMTITITFLNVRGIIPLTICLSCLFLMWIEASFGICIGCKIYWFLVNKKIIKEPKHKPKCTGNSCSI